MSFASGTSSTPGGRRIATVGVKGFTSIVMRSGSFKIAELAM
jgi:hypothetical protein